MTIKTKECGLYLANKKETIFAEWEEQANAQLRAAADTPDLVVRNYLPYFLANLVSELEKFDTTTDEHDFSQIDKINFDAKYSNEHGRSRATVSHYTVGQVITEYSLLRRVLRNHLYKQKLLCLTTAEIIDRFVETSCAEACQQFSNSLHEVQEKLISVIAHDLRNPISVARSYVEVGELGLAPPEQMYPALNRSLDRALALISELLDTSQLKAGHGMTFRFTEKDLVRELGVATNEAKEVYNNRVHFTTDLEHASVVCDHMSILRVVENLVSNGIKYGSVDTPITINLSQDDDMIQIRVHNKGSYIPPATQNSIFDFFSRNHLVEDKSKEGWGLGLYLVRLVAKAHCGRAWIESDKEQGTTFCISLAPKAHPEGTAFSEFL